MAASASTARTLVWFRGKDLRVTDHAPLTGALEQGGEVIPLFVVDPFFFAPKAAAELPRRMQFLLDSLQSLSRNIEHLGSKLAIVHGHSIDVIPRLVAKWRIDRVFAQRWTEPFARKRDAIIASRLSVPFTLFEGETLQAPETVKNTSGRPFMVFTPFARAFRDQVLVGKPLPRPDRLPPLPADLSDVDTTVPTLESLGLARNEQLILGGEKVARGRFQQFLADKIAGYASGRDRLDQEATSRLSADLKFGTLSVRTVWHETAKLLNKNAPPDVEKFRQEVLWREFAYALLWQKPELLTESFRDDFHGFPWQNLKSFVKFWQDGKTGYPVVDAAARQLLGEGYVHNRARMIAASFLTKHLLVDYRVGEAHYMKYLVDGDWAANNMGWQWSAGSGCDAQPYFRVFNPVLQGERYDPEGIYVRRWLPELKNLPLQYLHTPWRAPAEVQKKAGVKLGEDYPHPIVDHAEARAKFLALATDWIKQTRK